MSAMNWLLSEVNLVANLSLRDVTDLLQLPHPVLGCHGMPSPSGSTWEVREGGKWGRERERRRRGKEGEREGQGRRERMANIIKYRLPKMYALTSISSCLKQRGTNSPALQPNEVGEVCHVIGEHGVTNGAIPTLHCHHADTVLTACW